MADIVSMAPSLRAFEGLAMEMRSSLTCSSSTVTMATMTTGIARLLPVTLLRGPGRNMGGVGGGREGSGVVYSKASDSGERCLLQEGNEAVFGREPLDDLHDNQVLVDLGGGDPVLQGKLKLAGRDLPVQGLDGGC